MGLRGLVLLVAAVLVDQVNGHGRMLEPPSRASMWRKGFNTPHDYNDNQGFCGGLAHQTSLGGLCGICGDPWDQVPREHEVGGTYANGIITRTYRPGQDIVVDIEITANHLGFFEFRLCENNNTAADPTQACFSSIPVLPDLSDRFYIGSSVGMFHVPLRLPNVWCSQCIVQWTYTAGNNWGVCADGTGAPGCGTQEMFRACSDIAIAGTPVDPGSQTGISTSSTASPPPATTAPPPATTAPPPATTAPPPATTTTAPAGTGPLVCQPVGAYQGIAGMEAWCNTDCDHVPPICPTTHCNCD